MLTFSSSSTSVVNARRAMQECLEAALPNGESCDLIVIHAAIGHNFPELLDEARNLLPNARIVGCTCAGVIGVEGAFESLKALGVMTVSGEPNEFVVASSDNIVGQNSYEVGRQLAESLVAQNSAVNMVLLLASGIDIAADRALLGMESILGAEMPIFGATSSDNMSAISSYQFIDQQIFERGAVAIGFADPSLQVITRATHGFVPFGKAFTVTDAENNRIKTLDDEPAWPLLTDYLGLKADATLKTFIPIGAVAAALPPDLHEPYANSHILRVVTKQDDTGAVYLPVDCPVGTRLWLTQRDEQQIFDKLDDMLVQLIDECGDKELVAVFHADCGARGRSLFNRVLKDEIVGRMQMPLFERKQVPWLGMYGLGEFARLGDRNAFHNYTTALYILVRDG